MEVGQTFTPAFPLVGRLHVMSGLTQTFHLRAASLFITARSAQVSVIFPAAAFFKDTRVIRRARTDKTSAGIALSKVGDRRVALRGQSGHLFGQIAYQHGTGAGRRAPAVPGKGVKSGWQRFLYLAKPSLAKNTSHFPRL